MLSRRRPLRFELLECRRLLASVNIPDNLSGPPSGQVLAPVNIDDASGIRGAEIRISYDTTLLDASTAGVSAGSVWSQNQEDVEVVVNVDDAAGTIVAFVFAAEGLGDVSGSLLEIQFTIGSNAQLGGSTVLDLVQVRLNEGQIVPEPEPRPGPDSTDGRITFVQAEDTASVSGHVYADTNNNNQPDALEGIPGVTITLVNTVTSVQVQTVTADDGTYEFVDLAPGAYVIRQQQPTAYLEGGANAIAVQLAEGQSLTGQNFRELGLRPEFVYNRLFTTGVMPVGSEAWIDTLKQINVDAAAEVAEGTAAVEAAEPIQADASGEAEAVAEQTAALPEPSGDFASAEGEAGPSAVTAMAESTQVAPHVHTASAGIDPREADDVSVMLYTIGTDGVAASSGLAAPATAPIDVVADFGSEPPFAQADDDNVELLAGDAHASVSTSDKLESVDQFFGTADAGLLHLV